MIEREVKPSYYRPKARRLIDLSNEELATLFAMRSSKITEELKGHIWWDSIKSVYWEQFIPMVANLYECMLELQARYPTCEMEKYKYAGLLQVEPVVTKNGFKEI